MNTPLLTSSEEAKAPWNREDPPPKNIDVWVIYKNFNDNTLHSVNINVDVDSEEELDYEIDRQMRKKFPNFEYVENIDYPYDAFL